MPFFSFTMFGTRRWVVKSTFASHFLLLAEAAIGKDTYT